MRIVLLLFLACALSSRAAAPEELALLIPRSEIVRRIERAEAFGLLFAYGSDPRSYEAGVAAGMALSYRELLDILDRVERSLPPAPANR